MNKTKCHIGYGKGNDMITQEYKYEGEEFVITKPEACAMNVSRGEYTATISIHSATNQFRESLDGWGSDHSSLQLALDAACRRILQKSAKPTKEQLCSEMDEFYSSLNK